MPGYKSKKKHNPLKLTALFIIVIGILIYGSSILSKDMQAGTNGTPPTVSQIQKPPAPTNLNTFTIPGLISFNYPSDYSILYNSNSVQNVIQITTPSNNLVPSPVQIFIAIDPLIQNQSLLSFISQHPVCSQAPAAEPIPAYINQAASALAILDVNCPPFKISGIYTTDHGEVYTLTIQANQTYGQVKSVIAPILASLQF